jgi:hypothetical protein
LLAFAMISVCSGEGLHKLGNSSNLTLLHCATGHGPFSHVFDNEFMPRARFVKFSSRHDPDNHITLLTILLLNSPGMNWSHENASEMMLDYLIDDNHIDIDTSQINFIKDLIAGSPRSKRYKLRKLLVDSKCWNQSNVFYYVTVNTTKGLSCSILLPTRETVLMSTNLTI